MATYTGIPERRANASPTENLLSEAKNLGVDVSNVTEAELARATSDRRAELWLKENAEAIAYYNDYIEKNGLPLENYRKF
ncbi:type II toxin-antitoxin system CcdA family antitoxin [Paraburkholderia sp. HP33-1]|uniref:type II toxin-antitoxin system CcdA family antitoxin n=1 Tax=Paraburkholderia sp. HP33-1 TaxID=2883243 RepID=UPI001F36D5CA|nr:type II toxin-antitoxin system CcdA family antitoxin [Paraburkholderia sp. HP33-1]